MILLIDPIGPFLLLLTLKGLNRWILIHFYFRLISRNWIYFFGRFSGIKKAALEKLVPKCDIFFFSLKTIKWAGRWGGDAGEIRQPRRSRQVFIIARPF
jgi:hypothetical protein